MTETPHDRLRTARIQAGFRSAQEAAETLGWRVAGYRHHENGTRHIGLGAAAKYGRAFKIKPGWLLGVAGIDNSPPTDFSPNPRLGVIGSVAAGVWREPNEDFELFQIETEANVGNAHRLGFLVEGYSMDLCYEPGTVLDCISIFTNGVEPADGDHVIAERIKPDGLRELTVKEIRLRDGHYFLAPRSSRPEFQRELEIGAPDRNHSDIDDEVRVIAFVVAAIPPRSLRLLDRMGKIHR